jgi:hypothetical protein
MVVEGGVWRWVSDSSAYGRRLRSTLVDFL